VQPIGATQTRPLGSLALEDGQLVAQGEDLRLEFEARPKRGAEGGEQRDEQGGHRRERYQPRRRICNANKTFEISGRDRHPFLEGGLATTA
jgi:hypothetical protein